MKTPPGYGVQPPDPWGTSGVPTFTYPVPFGEILPGVSIGNVSWAVGPNEAARPPRLDGSTPKEATGSPAVDGDGTPMAIAPEASEPEHLGSRTGRASRRVTPTSLTASIVPLQIEPALLVRLWTARASPCPTKTASPSCAPSMACMGCVMPPCRSSSSKGWNAKRVQTVIGHASIQMTFDLYGKLFADDDGDKQAMARVEAALLAG